MKKTLLLLLTVLALLPATAQKKKVQAPAKVKEIPAYVTAVEGIKEYKLNNGLQVLLLPDPTQSNVVVNIVYHENCR